MLQEVINLLNYLKFTVIFIKKSENTEKLL